MTSRTRTGSIEGLAVIVALAGAVIAGTRAKLYGECLTGQRNWRCTADGILLWLALIVFVIATFSIIRKGGWRVLAVGATVVVVAGGVLWAAWFLI